MINSTNALPASTNYNPTIPLISKSKYFNFLKPNGTTIYEIYKNKSRGSSNFTKAVQLLFSMMKLILEILTSF
jgi:hypothetical protein